MDQNITDLIKEIAFDLNAIEAEVSRRNKTHPLFFLIFYPMCLGIGIGFAIAIKYFKWL